MAQSGLSWRSMSLHLEPNLWAVHAGGSMPAVKGKGSPGPTGQRYTPVSKYDDATLAQKREYWRKKKREQRARRPEKRRASNPSLNPLSHGSPFPLHHKTNLPANIRSMQTGNGTLANCQTQQFQHNPFPIASKIEVKCMPQVPVNKSVNSALISHLNSSSPVPPSVKTHSPQPLVSAPIPSVPNSLNPHVPIFIQPKTTANIATASSPWSTKSTPQLATKSALAPQQKPTSSSTSPAKPETEEEKAAKRRELWRVKKREQRARLAARLGKTKPRAQIVQKQHSGNAAPVCVPSPSSTLSRPFEKIQKVPPKLTAPVPFQTAPPMVVVKRPFEPIRKSPSPFHLSGVMRARCPTPWQSLIKQKLLKLKSPSLFYLCGGKGLPRTEPGGTPEQVISRKREYWRTKKREQRAKLSTEVKSRLKEKADFQRRVKRYHKILEDMRRARSQAIMHASETIGGFIKEDGTVTINIPQVTVNYNTHRGERVDNIAAYNNTQPQISQYNLQPPPVIPAPATMPMGQQTSRLQTGACSNSQVLPVQMRGSQLMLTHPPSLKPGSTTGGCVMKMAVSCKAPALVKAYLDPSLTGEERMAKKREYWRTKKREQRAARAVRLRQGVSQARASAVLLKRKAQKHVTAVSLSKRLPKASGSVINNNNMAYVNEMKPQVSEFVPAVDLNLNVAICPELKPPTSRVPPPAQGDPDPALSTDSQATTLLAVASMKKLLEESLGTVSECEAESEPGIIKTETETEEEKLEEDMKPDVSRVDVCAPIPADVVPQTDAPINEHAPFGNKDVSSPIKPPCVPHCTPEKSTQTSPAFIVHPKIETSECPQRRTQRTKKAGQHCCSPEPHKLHHPPMDMHVDIQEGHQSRPRRPLVKPSGLSSLQQKREYWKMMKRQQRARVKAKQKNNNNNNNSSSYMALRNVQSADSGCLLNQSSVMKPALLPKPSVQPASTNMPTVLLVSPSASNTGPQSTLRVKSPVSSREPGTEGRTRSSARIMNMPHISLPALKPPENPLSRVNPHPLNQNFTRNLRPITIPCPPKQNNVCPVKTVSSLVPPKPIPGESDESFQKRKREYWRVKKKEQRAKKAFQDKDRSPRQSCSQNLSQEPLQTHCEQESDEWMTPVQSEDSVNHSTDSDGGSFSFPSYPVPLDGSYGEYEAPGGEEGAESGDFWRNHYLMDYDPLNQLLVCMVCGDLQYVHNLEAVRGHIEEAHPHTLSLEAGERCRILQAWDEQMFQRERFFTNQLQLHSASATEAHMN